MDKHSSCAQCGKEVAELFCICTDLAPLGEECWVKHKVTEGFHFALPLAARDLVNARNQREFKVWLLNLSDSQAKLKANVPVVDKSFAAIKLGYAGLIQEMANTKDRVQGKVLEFKNAFSAAVDQAIKETSLNAYRRDYQPTTYLAWLVWELFCANSPEDIQAFSYEVKSTDERLKDSLEVVVQSAVPDLAPLAYTSGGSQIMKELQDLRSSSNEVQRLTAEASQLRYEGIALRREVARSKVCCEQLEADIKNALPHVKPLPPETAAALDKDFQRLLPFFLKTIHIVRGDPKGLEAKVAFSEDETVDSVAHQLHAFADAAEAHEQPVTTLEQKLETDERLDDILATLNTRPDLLERHYPTGSADLLLAKVGAIKEYWAIALRLNSQLVCSGFCPSSLRPSPLCGDSALSSQSWKLRLSLRPP